jgi:hypothetical protein
MSLHESIEWQRVLDRQRELRAEFDDPFGYDNLAYEARKQGDAELQRLLDEWQRSRVKS